MYKLKRSINARVCVFCAQKSCGCMLFREQVFQGGAGVMVLTNKV